MEDDEDGHPHWAVAGVWGFRGLEFRGLGFRGLGFRV